MFSDYNWTPQNEQNCNQQECLNGGICLTESLSGAPTCLCQPGFTGPNCETSMTACAEKPCLNEANCSENPSGAGYNCDCGGTGHTGRHCETVCQPFVDFPHYK